jgi:hypothetical protein
MRPDLAPTHAYRLSALAAALLDGAAALPDGLSAPGGGPVGRRFAVHRATATLGSIAALATRHPVLERLLGAETFAELARAFLRVDRPRTALLLGWGDALPDFVAAHPDLADWPWLADVARLERAWFEAHHAAEAEPMRVADLARCTPEDLAGARLRLHPSLRLLASPWAVVPVQVANGEIAAVAAEAEWAMILRPDADVGVHRLEAAAFAFVSAAAAGETVTAAATGALRLDAAFDAGAHLVDLVRLGAVVAIEIADHRENPT